MRRFLTLTFRSSLSLLLMLTTIEAYGDAESHVYKSPELGTHFRKVDPGEVRLTGNCMIYVPAYSHIYLTQKTKAPLAITLSIRNVDIKDSIYIKKVDYYNTEGKLLESLATGLFALTPLATVSFIIEQQDLRGGAGANFIVEWAAEKPVNFPIFEAVMAGYSGTKGLSFTSRGEKMQCDY